VEAPEELASVSPFKVDDARIRVLSEDELHTVLTAAPADVALMYRVTLGVAHGVMAGTLDAECGHRTADRHGNTLLLEACINPREIQRLAGWTESTGLRMLQRYGHVRDAEISRAVSVTAAIVE
jgi:hypothetical protein